MPETGRARPAGAWPLRAVAPASPAARALLTCAVLFCAGVAAAAWPPTTGGLVFLWENGGASNTVPTGDGIGRLSRVVPGGRAVFNRFWAMDLAGGSFVAEPLSSRVLREACRDADAFTLEAVIAGEGGQGGADIVSFGLSIGAAAACAERPAGACAAHGFVLGARDGALLFGVAGPGTGGSALVDAGAIPGDRPTHLVATFDAGRVAVHANGRSVFAGAGFDLSAAADAELRFGAPATWNGSVEGVALYARALSARDAAAHHDAYAARLAGRRPLPALRLDARLARKRPIPRAEVYPNSLVVYDYRVLRVAEGDYGEEKLLVAHRGNVNGSRNDRVADLVVGRRYSLDLEPFEAHPQLAGLQMVGNDEDWHLPLFHPVSDPE